MFSLQSKLQKHIQKHKPTSHLYQTDRYEGEHTNYILQAIIHEAVEAQRETSWRWWKQPKEVNKAKIKEECADIWHFLIQLSLEIGLTPEDIYKHYLDKNKENINRQDNNY